MPNFWEKHAVPRLIKFACSQPAVMKDRSEIVPKAQGEVLELGCGGGINLQFYDRSRVDKLTGLDPSAELLDYTRKEAKERGFEMDILDGVGEAMPFADDSFDTVLTTFTLCSVQDGKQVLKEMRRVLKMGAHPTKVRKNGSSGLNRYGNISPVVATYTARSRNYSRQKVSH